MEPSTRRQFLAALAGSTASLSGCSTVLDGDEPSNVEAPRDTAALQALPEAVQLEATVEGLDSPVAYADAAQSAYAYVVEQSGRVVAVDGDGRREEPALDIADDVTSGGEMGMLGLALHPEFPAEQRAFVRYSAPSRPGTPEEYSHTFVLSAFAVSDDGAAFVPGSERTILEIPEPQSNHNAGDLSFGPDGLLYVPTGDGGGADDNGTGHPEDWYDAVPGGNGQDVTEHLLGGLLRLDVDATPTEHPRTDAAAPSEPDGGEGYAIPDDNPLVGREGREEYYAWGLRNPWQLSFDEGGAGAGSTDLYVADVGQNDFEEVNLVVRGGNYGWNVREGAHCFAAESCPEETPADVRGGEPLRDPILEYPHGDAAVSGVSVVGGYRYRGDAIPALQGAYLFGDLQPAGRLFAAVPPASDADGDSWQVTTVDIDGASVAQLFAFGRDADGELYALGNGSDGGTLWRIRGST